MRPAKTQISLGIHLVWSESSLCAQWAAKDPRFLHVDSEDSDQPGRMPRLIWVFAGRTVPLLVFSWCGSFVFWHFAHILIMAFYESTAGAWRVVYIFYIFQLSSLSNVLSFGRPLNMTEMLWFRLLNPKDSCQLLPRTSSLITGYRLEDLSLPRNSPLLTDRLDLMSLLTGP